jgi:hypothetical protein
MLLQKYFPVSFLTALAIFSTDCASSQVIFVSRYNDAHLKIFVTEYKSDADLVVYKTPYKSDAVGNDGVWYFTEHKSDAEKVVRFVKSRNEADLIIYYTLFKNDAGWKSKSKESKLSE